ncbi:MAG: magnesium chelatase subunit ChlI family protein, partial [Gaiellales bacterium]
IALRVAAARHLLDQARPPLAGDALALLQVARERRLLSGRGAGAVVRVSQTIVALDGREMVSADDVAEALSYRTQERM